MTDNPIVTAIGLLTLLTLILLCAGLGWLAGRDDLSPTRLDDSGVIDDVGRARQISPLGYIPLQAALVVKVNVLWASGMCLVQHTKE